MFIILLLLFGCFDLVYNVHVSSRVPHVPQCFCSCPCGRRCFGPELFAYHNCQVGYHRLFLVIASLPLFNIDYNSSRFVQPSVNRLQLVVAPEEQSQIRFYSAKVDSCILRWSLQQVITETIRRFVVLFHFLFSHFRSLGAADKEDAWRADHSRALLLRQDRSQEGHHGLGFLQGWSVGRSAVFF